MTDQAGEVRESEPVKRSRLISSSTSELSEETSSDIDLRACERGLPNQLFEALNRDEVLCDRDLHKLKILLTLRSELRDKQILRRETPRDRATCTLILNFNETLLPACREQTGLGANRLSVIAKGLVKERALT